MKFMPKLFVIGLLTAAEVSPAQTRDIDALLSIVPGDAWGMICAPNPSDFDRKVSDFGRQLSLPIPASPLAMAKGYTGLLGGLDDQNAFALVIMPCESTVRIRDGMVLYVPTKNSKELLALLQPQEVSPGIWKINMANQTGYAAPKDAYTIIAPTEALLQTVTAPKSSLRDTLLPHQRDSLLQSDLGLWINVPGLLNGPLSESIKSHLQQMGVQTDNLEDLAGVTASLQLAPSGVRFGLGLDAKPGTKTASLAAAPPTSNASLLLGLPRERFVAAYGAVNSADGWSAAADGLDGMFDKIPLPARNSVFDETVWAKLRSLLKSLVSDARQVSVSINSMTDTGAGSLSMTAALGTGGSAEAAKGRLAELVQVVKTSSAKNPPTEGTNPSAEVAGVVDLLEYVPAAENVAGVPVDHLRFRFQDWKDAPKQGAAVIETLFGKDGLLFRIAAADERHLVITLGGGSKPTAAAVERVRAKETPLGNDSGIQRSSAQLPADRTGEMYVNVDELLRVAVAVGKAMDEFVPLGNIPEVHAPAALVTSPAGKSGSRTDLFVPMELILALRDLSQPENRKAPPNY